MPEAAFVIARHQDWATRDFAETLRYELDLQGVPSSVHEDGFPLPRPGVVYVLVAPREFISLAGASAVPSDSILARTVVVSNEHPDRVAQGDDVYLDLLRAAGAVFEVNIRSVGELHRKGVHARTLRPGYSKPRDHYDADAERPIDILFYASRSAHRTAGLAQLADTLARHNVSLTIADPAASNTIESATYLGASKYQRLSQSKILLDLHAEATPHLDWNRMLDAMHCGAVVVTEPAVALAPFTPGQQFVAAPRESMRFVLEQLLSDPDELARIRSSAYERLSSWLPFGLSVGVLRAALVELVGRPIEDGYALSGDVDATEADNTAGGPANSESEMRDTVASVQREVRALRRQLAALEIDQASESDGEDQAHTSPAWEARGVPQASVLIACGTDASRLSATLEALRNGRLADIELVLAVAAGAQEAHVTATEFAQANPELAIRIVQASAVSTRGALRNLALEHARAPVSVVVEPGDIPFRHGLERLVGSLNGMPQFALTYSPVGILAPGDTRGRDLTGIWGWEPTRLRSESWITTPYAVRTRILGDTGGFAEDVLLEGVEDYDLVCRLAVAGARAQLVSEILSMTRRSVAVRDAPLHGERGTVLVERSAKLLVGTIA
ncbi:MAG: glycosyltransferase [Solirubrobacterales bacterium]|nr:glycosyltransferase [Solirubrobacterales bacterium]